jgi:hypothetical protein
MRRITTTDWAPYGDGGRDRAEARAERVGQTIIASMHERATIRAKASASSARET